MRARGRAAPMGLAFERAGATLSGPGTPVTMAMRDARRTIGVFALAGVAFVGVLAAWAPAATAQVAPGGDVSSAAVGRAALPDRPRVEIPHPTLRVVGVPGRRTGTGEAPEARPSVTAVVLHALAGAHWPITRRIGLFFDYQFQSANTSFNLLNAPSDTKPHLSLFGGLAVRF